MSRLKYDVCMLTSGNLLRSMNDARGTAIYAQLTGVKYSIDVA